MEQPKVGGLTDLPNEILFKITAFLPPHALCQLAMTCKLLQTVADDNRSWEHHLSIATIDPGQYAKKIYELTPPHRKGYQPPPRPAFFSPRPGYCMNPNRDNDDGNNQRANMLHFF